MLHDYMEGFNITASGSAGTGKTFVALYLALNDILSPDTETERLVIVRSAVPSRDMGFTPGTLEEKAALYESPYQAMFADLFGRMATYQDMKDAHLVDFQTTSYLRGVTWDNAIVVVDECQSMTFHEINTIMTRLGKNSRIIMCGDLPQTDLRKKGEVTGMDKMLRITARMGGFSNVTFTVHDIVRSAFVKSWIMACEEEGD
jgi:phosphate starvation-inducible PhoH-like protein